MCMFVSVTLKKQNKKKLIYKYIFLFFFLYLFFIVLPLLIVLSFILHFLLGLCKKKKLLGKKNKLNSCYISLNYAF